MIIILMNIWPKERTGDLKTVKSGNYLNLQETVVDAHLREMVP